MLYRAALLSVTLFWLLMNVLLWRAEYGQRDAAHTSVPVAVVWHKMLTAPDTSSLTILHHGKKIGFCHWMTSIGEELSKLKEEDVPPEGMVERVSGYRIQLEGNVALPDFPNRVRFDCALKLATNQLWQEFSLRLNLRPAVWELRSVATEQTLRLKVEDGGERLERVIKFSELQDPAALLRDVAGPFAYGMFSAIHLPIRPQSASSRALGLEWEARNDSAKIGQSLVRAYRLQARLLDRYQARIFVSRVGEILRVDLPDEVVLLNDQLANF